MEQLNEYKLKIDSYYFYQDKIVIVIKLKNKRYVQKISLDEIMQNQYVINNLHPFDVCLLGILHSNQNNLKEHETITVPDVERLIKISECLEIVETVYTDNGSELFVIKPKFFNKKIKVSAENIYNQFDLISGLNQKQAFFLGMSLPLEKSVNQNSFNINYLRMTLPCLNFALMVITILLLKDKIDIALLNINTTCVLIPLILFMNYMIYNKLNAYFYEGLFFSLIGVIAFMFYFSVIFNMPFSSLDKVTLEFNQYFSGLSQKALVLIISIYLMLYKIGGILNFCNSIKIRTLYLQCTALCMIFYAISMPLMYGTGYNFYDFGVSLITSLLISAFFYLSKQVIMIKKKIYRIPYC